MTNVIAQTAAQPTKTLVADAVENYGVHGSNFNLTSTSVIANGMQISVASQKVIADRISGVNQAIFALEQLEAEREHWEANEQAASHKRFYGLLYSNYTFYLEMKLNPSADVREAHKKGLETFLLTRNFSTRLENTHDMNKVVKSVFGNIDRRRVSAYALALRAALVAGGVDSEGKKLHLPADKLVDWLISPRKKQQKPNQLLSRNHFLLSNQMRSKHCLTLKMSTRCAFLWLPIDLVVILILVLS